MKTSVRSMHRAIFLIPLLLMGCANQISSNSPSSASTVAEAPSEAVVCEVLLTQEGKELKYQLAGRTRIYQLKRAPFQIEVSSEKCNPSIGTFRDLNDHMFVSANPYAISVSGMAVASTPKDDVLVRRSENPRPTPDVLEAFDAQKKEILQLCEFFKRCPTQIVGIRNYWNFRQDDKGTPGKIAEIRNFTGTQPLTRAFGLVPVVVYTKAKTDDAEYRGRGSNLDILETHPLFLIFT